MLLKVMVIVMVSPSTYIASKYLGYKAEIKIFDLLINCQVVYIIGVIFSILCLFLPLGKFKNKFSFLLCGIHLVLCILTVITAIQVYISSNLVIFENGEIIVKKITWESSELEKIMPDIEKKIGIKILPSEKKFEILSRSKNPEELHDELEKYKKSSIILTQVLEDRKVFYMGGGAFVLLGLFFWKPLIERILFGTVRDSVIEPVKPVEPVESVEEITQAEGVFREITKMATGEKIETKYLFNLYHPFENMSEEEMNNCLRRLPVYRIPSPNLEMMLRLSCFTLVMLQDFNVGTSLVERKVVIPEYKMRILAQDLHAKSVLPRGIYLNYLKVNKNSWEHKLDDLD